MSLFSGYNILALTFLKRLSSEKTTVIFCRKVTYSLFVFVDIFLLSNRLNNYNRLPLFIFNRVIRIKFFFFKYTDIRHPPIIKNSGIILDNFYCVFFFLNVWSYLYWSKNFKKKINIYTCIFFTHDLLLFFFNR